MPEVSVIIPAYNPGDFLHRSLNSVLGQSFSNLECVVVDDGSAEDLTWLNEHPDRRVRYHRQPNSGVSVARNVGAALGRGRLLAFLDQDDEWLPGKLEGQIAALGSAPGAAFCYTGFVWVLPTGPTIPEDQKVTYAGLLRGEHHVCLSTLLVDRERYLAVGGHSPLLAQQQDWDLMLNLMLVFGDPIGVGGPFARYHVHGENASTDNETAAREAALVLESHRIRAERRGDRTALDAVADGLATARRLYGHQAIDDARTAWHARERLAALHHLRRAWTLSPRVVAEAAAAVVRARSVRTATRRARR